MTTFLERVNENERKVLEYLAESWSDEVNCYFFKGIAEQTKLEIKQVRRACRSLKKKGYAEFVRGLFDDDGMVAGSGYCATRKGAALISPCDVCGDLATYDYNVEEDGTQTSNDDEKTRHIRECEEHYKKSPKLNPVLL